MEYGWCKLSLRPTNTTPTYLFKRNGKLCLDKTCISMFIYSFISCVPVRTSFNWWIDKHAVVYPCNSILQSYKEKWTVYIWNKIDESHRLRETAVVQSLSHVQFFVPYGLQHTRLPCPSPCPRACSNSCALSRWYHATIFFSLAPCPPALDLSLCQNFF